MMWTVHLEGGPRRVNHAAVCVGSDVYSFGGYCSTGEYRDWDPIPVYKLDTQTLRWSAVNYYASPAKTPPFQRYGHTTVAEDHKVYMWGGRNNAVACEILSIFDTKLLEWSSPPVTGRVPFAKDGHSACLVNNRMYIFGGFEYLTDQYSQEVHYLDLETMEWNYVAATGSIPSHRDFHTAVAVGDRMYVFGGRADLNGPLNSQEEVYCPEVYYLDTVREEWVCVKTKEGICPEGRRSHSAWYYKGYMYIFGGFNGNTNKHFNDLYRFSISDNSWEYVDTIGKKPCRRRRQACINYQNKVYMFGGTSPCPHEANRAVDESEDNPERLIDNSDLHVFDYSPSLKTLCILKVIEYQLDGSILPRDVKFDLLTMSIPNRVSRPINQAG